MPVFAEDSSAAHDTLAMRPTGDAPQPPPFPSRSPATLPAPTACPASKHQTPTTVWTLMPRGGQEAAGRTRTSSFCVSDTRCVAGQSMREKQKRRGLLSFQQWMLQSGIDASRALAHQDWWKKNQPEELNNDQRLIALKLLFLSAVKFRQSQGTPQSPILIDELRKRNTAHSMLSGVPPSSSRERKLLVSTVLRDLDKINRMDPEKGVQLAYDALMSLPLWNDNPSRLQQSVE